MAKEQLTLELPVANSPETDARPIISRAEARAKGLKRYYLGQPCVNGHVAERMVINSQCLDCAAVFKENRRAKGLQYLGRPCKYGHEGWRLTSNGACLECCRLKENARRANDVPAALEREAKQRTKHRVKRRADYRKWRAGNRETAIAATEAWKAENQEGIREYQRAYSSARYAKDLAYRLRGSLRRGIGSVLRRGQRAGSAVSDLGCSVEELIAHIESKFHDGMSWSNWGKAWELDHIRPLGSFALSDREQFLQACHYTNLQPLSLEEHRIKTQQDVALIRARKKKARLPD